MPCVTGLRLLVALPSTDVGPVEFCAAALRCSIALSVSAYFRLGLVASSRLALSPVATSTFATASRGREAAASVRSGAADAPRTRVRVRRVTAVDIVGSPYSSMLVRRQNAAGGEA